MSLPTSCLSAPIWAVETVTPRDRGEDNAADCEYDLPATKFILFDVGWPEAFNAGWPEHWRVAS